MARTRTSGQRAAAGLLGLLMLPVLLVVLIVALPFLAVGGLLDKWRRLRLRRQFEAKWAGAGKRGLLVYSGSPNWQAYIEERWLPRLDGRLVVLNWSERSQWSERHPLEGEILRRYLGDREFNPAAILFPEGREVRVVRFWQPFRDFRHGKDAALRAAEAELFRVLADDTSSLTPPVSEVP